MSYKIKSLIYFTCYAASAILYYTLESKIESNLSARTIETPKTESEKKEPENNLILLSYKEE